jgi:hypothetical protein
VFASHLNTIQIVFQIQCLFANEAGLWSKTFFVHFYYPYLHTWLLRRVYPIAYLQFTIPITCKILSAHWPRNTSKYFIPLHKQKTHPVRWEYREQEIFTSMKNTSIMLVLCIVMTDLHALEIQWYSHCIVIWLIIFVFVYEIGHELFTLHVMFCVISFASRGLTVYSTEERTGKWSGPKTLG